MKNKVDYKRCLCFLFIFLVSTALIFAETKTATASKNINPWIKLMDFFNGGWVKGICCILLIGQCLGIVFAGGQNPQIFKKLLPFLIGTLLFMCAGKIIGIVFSPAFKFGIGKMPSFDNVKRYIDIPLAKGIGDFVQIMYNLESFAITLVTIFAFLNIVFNAFKLWAGTVEMKKVYVDIIYKSVLCILLMNFYPTIQASFLQVSSNIGANVAGGKQKIEATFVTAFKVLKNTVNNCTEDFLKKIVEKGAITDVNGNSYISTTALKTIQEKYYVSDEDIQAFMVKYNLQPATSIYADEITEAGPNGPVTTKFNFVEYRDSEGKKINQGRFSTFFGKDNKDKSAAKVIYKSQEAKEVKKAFNKIEAIAEVLTGYSVSDAAEWDDETKASKMKELMNTKLDQIAYQPYLTDDNGNQTNFIAPSSILKTCWLMTDCITLAAQYTTEGDSAVAPAKGEEREIDKEANKVHYIKKGNFLWEGLKALVIGLIYWCGMFICSIVVMAEYTICIWEYLIVSSLAILLIPFMFLDSTKSYAQNILKIFLSYFAKILVITIACFYVLGLYLDTATTTITANELNAMTSIGTYLLILILGLTFSTGAEKIASILFTGSPTMSMGDIVKGARDVGMVAGMAGKAAAGMGKAVGAIGKGGQNIVNGGMNLGGKVAGANAAKDEAREGLKSLKETGQFSGDAKAEKKIENQAWRKAMGSSIKQDIKDGLKKTFTGQDAHHDRGKDFLKVGQQAGTGENAHKAGFKDVKEQNQNMGKSIGQDVALKASMNQQNAGANGRHKTKFDPAENKF